jgi:hypothetical protein
MIRFMNHLIQKIHQRKNLQHPKALKRAPQGTLAFRSYLLMKHRTTKRNKAFGGLETLLDRTNMLHMELCRYFGLYGIEMYAVKIKQNRNDYQ